MSKTLSHDLAQRKGAGHWYVNEIAGLFNGLNQYKGKGNDEQRFISMLDGVDLPVDRGEINLLVDNPFISALGTTQPQIIKEIMSKYKDNGLAYRFCYCYSPKGIYRVKESEPIDNAPVNTVFSAFDFLPMQEQPITYEFTNDARKKAMNIINNDFVQLQSDYDDCITSGIISKIRTEFINFCLLIHCLNNYKDLQNNLVIDIKTVEKAYLLSMFFLRNNYLTLGNSVFDFNLYNKLKKHSLIAEQKGKTYNVNYIRQYVCQKQKREDVIEQLNNLAKQNKIIITNDNIKVL